jgi:outer membrane protein
MSAKEASVKKHFIALALAVFFAATPLSGEQITRYAVVDLVRILESFYKDSKAMRDFEERQRSIQKELDKMTEEIKSLQQSKVEAQAAGKTDTALSFESDIQAKIAFVRDYRKVKTEELETQKRKIFESDTMAAEIYQEIQKAAESEGYTMVLDWKRGTELRLVIWYSPTIDITDKVIASLMAKKR